MTVLKIGIVALAVLIAACASTEPAFDIRGADRPEYTQTVSPEQLDAFKNGGGIVADVRLAEDFQQDPRLIPGAIRVDPENADYWLSADKSKPVALYCVKGKWVSQKTASYLSSLGFETYSLEGGLVAFDEFTQSQN